MIEPIISAKTRNEFREYYVNTTLRQIQDAFDGGGVRCDLEYQPPTSGQRRSLVEQYYHTVDWTNWKSVSRVVKVYENELRELYAPVASTSVWGSSNEDLQAGRKGVADKLLYWLRQDGFEWVAGKLVRAAGTPALDDLHSAAHKLEGTHIAQQIQRMKDAVEADPSLAIGTAKELIETVCKAILEERGKPIEGTPDIPTLTKALLKELQLVPEGVPDGKRGADTIKSVLRSLGSIGNDLAQLRGLYGTGHGKTANTQPLRPRHAKLAVGAAATFVTFLVETHQESAGVRTGAGD
ncbi:MAG: abortive infection family protein [Panacagrimonas sp.]